MARDNRSSEGALADRLVSYADAIAALAFVGVSGLGLAVADPEIRIDVSRAADWILVGNVTAGFVLSGILLLLRRWEFDLRSELAASAKVRRYSRRLHFARIGVVWLATVQAVGLMLVIR